MHRIWIINLEGVLDQAPTRENLAQHLSRYLHFVSCGDLFFTSLEIPEDYLRYLCALRKLPDPQEWLIKAYLHIPYFLCDCIQRDEKLMNTLRELTRGAEYILEPFIDSPKVVSLSEKTGIPFSGSPASLIKEGVIKKLNEKIYFRDLSNELGIAIAPGMAARNVDELRGAVNEICRTPQDRAIIKKSFSGGGYGNLAGDRETLLLDIPSWFDGSEYVVEQLLDLEYTVGSLVEISDDGFVFKGLDRQIIENFGWRGCYYPFKMDGVSEEIERLSSQYAETIHKMGARGLLNADWGLVRQKNGDFKIYAIEINLRHNGFHYILQLSREYFDIPPEALNVLYYGSFKVSKNFREFSQVLELAEKVTLNGNQAFVMEKGMRNGFLFTSPLKDGAVGLLIAGESRDSVEAIESEIKAVIG